jgi:MYXO-CTERM domain-containing protein
VLTQPDQLQGAKITAITYTGDQVSASYAAWATHAKANGWFDRVFDYTCDEPPNGCNWSDIPTRAAIVHMGDPNFRTLTTTTIQAAQANNVLSSLDILVPIINEMYGTMSDPYPGNQRGNYATFLTQPNKLLWMYQSCEPSSSCSNGTLEGYSGWPTMFIDESAVSNRMMQWMDFAYQVSAELYYDTTYAMSSATNDAWTSQYEFGNNGDGSIWYPGKPSVIGGTHDIPIESLRMKMLREGMQDYEYLNMLTTLGDGAFAQAQLATVVSNAMSFASDPSVLEAARLAMAAEIEKDIAASDAGAGGADAGSKCGTSGDGGAPGTDGGTRADGGSVGMDGGPVADSGAPSSDSGETGDGGSASGGSGSKGCGCRLTGHPTGSDGSVAVAIGLGVLGARRRRRRG